MNILKAFKIADESYEVNIQGTNEEPLFQANQIAKILGIKNVRQTLANFEEDEKVVTRTYTPGGMQNVTFLTEIGLYKLINRSTKKEAKVFQKWICKVAKEIFHQGKYELKDSNEIDKKIAEYQIELARHNVFLSTLANKDVIYLSKIKNIDDTKFILKLGYSDDIKERQKALQTQFGNSVFQEVFECKQNKLFEKMLKKHPKIHCYAYTDKIINEVRSTETYLVTKEEYNSIVKIIKRNIDNYQGFNAEQYIELEKIKLQNKELDIKSQEIELKRQTLLILSQNKDKKQILELEQNLEDNILNFIKNDEVLTPSLKTTDDDAYITEIPIKDDDKEKNNSSEDDDNVDFSALKIPRTNTRNNKVQQYDPNTLKLIKTFDGLMDVIRAFPEMSKFGVKHAATVHTIYRNYRWHFIDRNAEEIEYELPPTNYTHSSVPRHIAMINKTKTEIENVFTTLTAAAASISSKRKTTICEAIKKGNLVRNSYYFSYFEDCSEELRNKYLSQSKLQALPMPKGTRVEQIDIKTQKVIKTYDSIAHVLKECCISRASLKNACMTKEAFKGFLWKFAEQFD